MRGLANRYGLNHWRRAQVKGYGEVRPDSGTSINQGAGVARDRGFIDEYQWATTVDEIRDAIIAVGPVVLGIPWLNSMNQTTGRGLAKVNVPADMSGVGYHAVVLNGYDPAAPVLAKKGKTPAFRLRNSWGTLWGADDPKDWKRCTGEGWITPDDLEALLEAKARTYSKWSDAACLPVGRNPVDLAAVLAANPDPYLS